MEGVAGTPRGVRLRARSSFLLEPKQLQPEQQLSPLHLLLGGGPSTLVECFRRVNSGGECGAPRGEGGRNSRRPGDLGRLFSPGTWIFPRSLPPRAPLAPCFHPPRKHSSLQPRPKVALGQGWLPKAHGADDRLGAEPGGRRGCCCRWLCCCCSRGAPPGSSSGSAPAASTPPAGASPPRPPAPADFRMRKFRSPPLCKHPCGAKVEGRGAGPRPRPGLTARRARRPQGVREVPAVRQLLLPVRAWRRSLLQRVVDSPGRPAEPWASLGLPGKAVDRHPPRLPPAPGCPPAPPPGGAATATVEPGGGATRRPRRRARPPVPGPSLCAPAA